MNRLWLLVLTLACNAASAIVIRDDVEDSTYRIPAQEFPALVDLPGEGHGVLIASRWVVTAAHAVAWQPGIRQVSIDGTTREVDRVVMHPGHRSPPQELLNQALATWDWTLFRAHLAASDDIALLRLARPVTDVAPATISTRNGEVGEVVRVIGKGATGHGAAGYAFSSPRRTELRHAFNKITSAHGRWLCYRFDEPSEALPFEGAAGSGDSGGPVLVQVDTQWLVAGLTAWVDPQSSVRRPGRYGQFTCNVRLSHYKEWIDQVIASPE